VPATLDNIHADLLALIAAVNAQTQAVKPISNVVSRFPLNPAGTTSASTVMMGLAVPFTPSRSGNVLITISGEMENSTSGDGVAYVVRVGTGTAPANGAAAAGTQVSASPELFPDASASGLVPFSITAIATGQSLGVAMWIDLGLSVVNGGTATVANVTVVAAEV
jgi:hypothetical protein